MQYDTALLSMDLGSNEAVEEALTAMNVFLATHEVPTWQMELRGDKMFILLSGRVPAA